VYASGVVPEVSLPEARRWLEAAADKSNPEAALALSGLLADGSEQDRAAAQQWLARAASEGHPTAVKLMASHALPLAPSRDAAGDTALARELLVWAIRHGDEKTLDAFIKVAGVENADQFGRTPLQYAVMSGSDVAVQHLLAAGADTAHADQFGVTPLMLAAEAESDAILDELVKTGTDINKKDSAGDTALFYAARVGRTDHTEMTAFTDGCSGILATRGTRHRAGCGTHWRPRRSIVAQVCANSWAPTIEQAPLMLWASRTDSGKSSASSARSSSATSDRVSEIKSFNMSHLSAKSGATLRSVSVSRTLNKKTFDIGNAQSSESVLCLACNRNR